MTEQRSGTAIAQEEIQMVLDVEKGFTILIANIRRRLAAGAAVEPGKWQLESDASEIQMGSLGGGTFNGLDIFDAVEKAKHAAAGN